MSSSSKSLLNSVKSLFGFGTKTENTPPPMNVSPPPNAPPLMRLLRTRLRLMRLLLMRLLLMRLLTRLLLQEDPDVSAAAAQNARSARSALGLDAAAAADKQQRD